jgi:hypothetical protein
VWLGCDASGNVILISWFWRCGRLLKRAWNNDLRWLIKLNFLKYILLVTPIGVSLLWCTGPLIVVAKTEWLYCRSLYLLEYVEMWVRFATILSSNEYVQLVLFHVFTWILFFGYLPVLFHLPGWWFFIVMVTFLLCNGRMSCMVPFKNQREELVWFNTWEIVCGDGGGRLEMVSFRPFGPVFAGRWLWLQKYSVALMHFKGC